MSPLHTAHVSCSNSGVATDHSYFSQRVAVPLTDEGYARSVKFFVAIGVAACLIVIGGAERVPAGGGCFRDVQNIEPEFSPDGSAVVFVSEGKGGCSPFGRLLLATSAGGEPRDLLAASGALALRPHFSPEGTRILTTVLEDGSAVPVVAIVTLAGERRDLAAGNNPFWSADGAEVAFTPAGRPGEVWAIGSDGTGLHRIGSGSEPIWSPDGRLLAVRDTGGPFGAIAVIHPDGTGHRQVADGAYPYYPVLWDRDGRRIGFLAGEGDVLRVVDVEGGMTRSYPVPGQANPIAWSAAGGALALRGGAQLSLASGTVTRAFAGWDVLAVTRDWSRAAVSVAAGRYFAWEGNDLYVAEPLGSGARLVSPRRCPAVRRCLEGDDAANTLRAAQPNSWLRGLAGHDSLTGSSGFDRIEGALGDDLIVGNAGNDHLFGDVGRDRIFGGVGDDYVDGGPGDDVLVSGSGGGRIFAGPGNDRIDARRGRGTTVHCSDGVDTVRANRSTRIARDCERVRTGIPE
jgi:Ca2+-binding RTX toxin-like protein